MSRGRSEPHAWLQPNALATRSSDWQNPADRSRSPANGDQHHSTERRLHFDHAGGLSLLPPRVPIVVQRREWDGARSPDSIARNFYLPVDCAGIEEQVRLVDGDHDLLGDGSVRLLFTSGHTPGHQSIMVAERLVIGADVCHFASGLDDHRFPIFADDHAAQATSAERLRALRDAGATVIPGHDPGVLRPGRW